MNRLTQIAGSQSSILQHDANCSIARRRTTSVDQLETLRQITDANNSVVWEWDGGDLFTI